MKKLPASLKNIFKEIEHDVGTSSPFNGNLERWSHQGVLLLNTILTVEEGKPGAHGKFGWDQFTHAVIQNLNKHLSHVVFILWGSHAQMHARYIDHSRHLIIQSVHPSPLSAYRGFFGSKPFSRANDYLKTHGKSPITW
jgi:uracil-DNA glycosylase